MGLNKADVLAALYNASKPQGMGFMNYDPKPMTREDAEKLLKESTSFDYLKGRVVKVNLSGDEFDPYGHDRDNGQGAAERVITELRTTGETNSALTQATHDVSTLKAAEDVKVHLNEETSVKGNTIKLDLADVAHKLEPVVDKVIQKKLQ